MPTVRSKMCFIAQSLWKRTSCQPCPPCVCHKPKLLGLPHRFGTRSTMRQLPRSFEGLVSLRVQIQKVGLFGLHFYLGDVSNRLSVHLALGEFIRSIAAGTAFIA